MTPVVPTEAENQENTPIPVAGETSANLQSAHPSINDVWAQYYAQDGPTVPASIHVCETIHCSNPWPLKDPAVFTARHQQVPAPPPILIDSGASCSAVGEKWLQSWGSHQKYPKAIHSEREFRFGDWPTFPSLGEMVLPTKIPKERTSDSRIHILAFRVDVVKAARPCSFRNRLSLICARGWICHHSLLKYLAK